MKLLKSVFVLIAPCSFFCVVRGGASNTNTNKRHDSSIIQDIRDDFLHTRRGLEMGLLSQLVYTLDTNNRTTFDANIPPRYQTLGWIDSGSTEVLVLETVTDHDHDNANEGFAPIGSLLVIFRGSEEIEDWIVNVDQFQVPFGFPNHTLPFPMYQPTQDGGVDKIPVLAHRGFNRVFRIYDDVIALLDGKTISTLHVAGHSLGGANAALFSTLYAFRNPPVSVYTTTFGAPRPGNRGYKIFAEQLRNLNLWRLVNRRDIVPRVPVQDFTHAGSLVWRRPDEGADSGGEGDRGVRAYYRQIGNRGLGWRGIPDFLIAVVRSTEEGSGLTEGWIGDHFNPEYTAWMQAAVDDPDVHFTAGYEQVN